MKHVQQRREIGKKRLEGAQARSHAYDPRLDPRRKSDDVMWAVHLALSLMALYAAIITGMYLAQTWLLFPTALARIARVQTSASTQRLEVQTSDGESLIGVRIGGTASGRPTLLGFGANAWNAKVTALTLHNLLPDHDVVAFHYRGYAPSSGRPSARALLSDSLVVFDCLRQALAHERMVLVEFSIESGVADYLAQRRPVAELILVTPFDSLETLARDPYWWAPERLLLRHPCPRLSSFAAR
jgi:hypothetical protein